MPDYNQSLTLGISKKWLKSGAVGLSISLVCGVLLLNFSHEGFSLQDIKRISASDLSLLTAMVSVAWICNGLRTWILSKIVGVPIPIHQALGITLSMEFAIACTPGGIGGLITRMALQKRLGMPYQKTTSLMAADWLADLFFFLALTPVGIYQAWEWLPSKNLVIKGFGPEWVCALLFGFMLISLPFVFRRSLSTTLPHSVKIQLKGWWKNLMTRLQQHYREALQCLGLIYSRYRLSYCFVLFFASLQWTCRYGVLVVILWALDLDVQPILLMLIQGSLFLIGLIVVAPGGGGAVELITSFALTPMVGVQNAVIAVVVWRFFTYYLYLAGGGLAFALVTYHFGVPVRSAKSTTKTKHEKPGPA